MDFFSVTGHAQVIEHLQKAISLQKVSHAYIFNGEDGAGKNLMAGAFAKTLLCEEGGINPCGKCKSCRQIESGNQPDLIYVTHEKQSIGVDDIRLQVNDSIQIKPYSSKYKIYIIDEAEKMTEQAQNALLKTIEEPPSYAILILLTNNSHFLLQTILSRCVQLNLKTVATNLIKSYLMNQGNVPDYVAQLSAQFAQGNVGKAIKYASSQHFVEVKENCIRIMKAVKSMELFEIMDSIKVMIQDKTDIMDFFDLMTLWYRDVLLYKVTQNEELLLFQEEIRAISQQAMQKEYAELEAILNAIDKAKLRLNANVNAETALELMLLAMKEN